MLALEQFVPADPSIPANDGGRVLPADLEFSEMLAKAIPSLRRFAYRLSRNASSADDLSQEALAKAWAAKGSFIAGSNFLPGLCRILRNQHYSEFRRRRHFADWDQTSADRLLQSPAPQIGRLELSELGRFLESIREEQRSALLLVCVQGHTYAQAARLTGCSVGTIKSRVSRGRRALKDRYSAGFAPSGIGKAGTASGPSPKRRGEVLCSSPR